MATIKGFLVGLITGAVVAYWFRDWIAARIDARTETVRSRTAHRLHAAADAIEKGIAGAEATATPTRIVRSS
ncbi:MAG TPA: hypothetical protein VFR64_20145 [Methylomirabilota bacterium]|nr:hypothetical protein [Methylomirabilota bacterium]